MKKNLLAIALGSVIALTAAPYSLAANDSTIQSSADYSQLVTKRQVVDQLLNDAVEAFKSPARISHAGFTAKMPSNMEIVTDRLLEAYQLEPYRTDLLISAANAQIYNKNVDRAIELFEQALAVAPDDVDLHAYLAVWQRFKGNQTESDQHMTTLAKLNAGKAADIKRIFDTVDRVLATPLKDKADKGKLDNKGAIVTLGYALNPDGSMHQILVERLQTTLAMAKANPDAIIILTGGVPKNHKTEGKLMADWLIEKGVSKDRIIEENYATSTVGNALLSSYALARHNIKHATIISSASHVRRGQTLFEIASWQTGPQGITFDTVSYPDKPLKDLAKASESELLGIYRDALRTYGMWSYRSYPLESR
ncbi:YdcF family protein [Vibrio parahaemolyticus]|uniref:YdcF family protein n=1 Tax=Vibrio parahaemolyticus TaxID=670 RepID=UPI001B80E8B8|nr:YdcF family protein [Vibrio parahaemolyticus]EJC1075287.1 YdcF family protein [Vibrio parahaemolyticus]EJK2180303.1 YdcF family protein [Vibrio parahaemolyticus]ELA7770233.1 YdcF family protein [Vibrio parahaemolyticus]MDF4982696.1 YdcF family protein [Vibrio parahaemolyticus]HAV1402399.1 YdcF family protein [Vibrio parahaemolyticus]